MASPSSTLKHAQPTIPLIPLRHQARQWSGNTEAALQRGVLDWPIGVAGGSE